MKKLHLLRFALLALASLPAFSQQYEIGPYFAFDKMTRKPLGSVRQTGGANGDTRFGDGKGFGLRLTLNTKGYYGHEVHYVRSLVPLTSNVDEFVFNTDGTVTIGAARDRREKVRTTRLGYNFLMYMMPAGEWWRPYLTIGAFTTQTKPPNFIEWTSAGTRNVGANFGGGIKLFPRTNVLMRIDFRHMLRGRPYTLNFPSDPGAAEGNVGQMEFSAGFSYAFGKF